MLLYFHYQCVMSHLLNEEDDLKKNVHYRHLLLKDDQVQLFYFFD